jgi:hypothetical protein
MLSDQSQPGLKTHRDSLENITSGANPTIVSYNTSAVKIYNATSSLVRFENKTVYV